ncbi:MAG: hypothetical protein EOM19_04010 [Candidatus Moranbacteria bacterium]|nr:hypothetical protein [Candidatus Moranbacteria bacterium]
MEEEKKLTEEEILNLKFELAKRWIDPVQRIEDIFNIRNSQGELMPYKVPEPQKKLLRDGILGKGRKQITNSDKNKRVSYISITNKGRQMGFSVINAAEAVLIAEDFPYTMIYYVATTIEQAKDWMDKMMQLIQDSNHYPEELGGGPILNIQNIKKIFEKQINDTMIVGLAANPSGIRGKTAIAVYFDEAAWALRTKDIAHETWKALKYFISQGGQARIQSTPRTSDEKEFFWGMYQKALKKEGGLIAYECPVIENWRDLDLDEPLFIELDNEQRVIQGLDTYTQKEIDDLKSHYNREGFEVTDTYIKQPVICKYEWKTLQELENDRANDKQMFLQEYLCQPVDEAYKVILSEWIENNIVEEPEYVDRGTSTNEFQICCDFAKEKDQSAFIVTEKIITNGIPIFYQRNITLCQNPYYEQARIIADLYYKFQPTFISIDDTGVGKSVVEQLEQEFLKQNIPLRVIKKVTFSSQINEQMAEGFKALCTPKDYLKEKYISGYDEKDKPIYNTTYKNQYRFLREPNNKIHKEAIAQIKRVEKEILRTNVRYSGKRYGRDDAFWCFKDDTEVLTENGWKLIKNVDIGEKVYSYNKINTEIELKSVISTFNKYYEGEMYRFKSKSIDMTVTPNHKMLAYRSMGANRYYDLEEIEAKDLYDKHFRLLKFGGINNIGEKPMLIDGFDSKYFLLLIGIIIGDGCVTASNRRIDISCPREKQSHPIIIECLNKLGLKINYAGKDKHHNCERFYIYSSSFKKIIDKYIQGKSPYKRIDRSLLNLHPDLLKYIYKGLMITDGHSKQNIFFTSSIGLASDFQELCFKLGYGATISETDNIGEKAPNGITNFKEYSISITQYTIKRDKSKPRFNHHRKEKNAATVEKINNYKGNVVCIEVEDNHTMFIRDNNRCCWSGNSSSQLVLHETPKRMPKAAFGKTSALSTKYQSKTEEITKGQQYVFNINKKRWETRLDSIDEQRKQVKQQKSLLEKRNYTKNLKFAYDCLRNTKLKCNTRHRIVNPIECSNPNECRNDNCPSYKYVKEIIDRYNVDIEDLYRIFTKFYKE